MVEISYAPNDSSTVVCMVLGCRYGSRHKIQMKPTCCVESSFNSRSLAIEMCSLGSADLPGTWQTPKAQKNKNDRTLKSRNPHTHTAKIAVLLGALHPKLDSPKTPGLEAPKPSPAGRQRNSRIQRPKAPPNKSPSFGVFGPLTRSQVPNLQLLKRTRGLFRVFRKAPRNPSKAKA